MAATLLSRLRLIDASLMTAYGLIKRKKMKNLRKKRNNPARHITSDKIKNFVEKFFKSIDRKSKTITADDYGLDYPSAIVELSDGTYMIGFNPDEGNYFTMTEVVYHGDYYTPDDSEFIENDKTFPSLPVACVNVAVQNEKERHERQLMSIDAFLEEAEMMEDIYNEDIE